MKRSTHVNVKMTHTEIARRSGLSLACVSRILSGKRTPRLATLKRLAQAMDVPTPKLMSMLDDLIKD